MLDKDFYDKLLGLTGGWTATNVELNTHEKKVTVHICFTSEEGYRCPDCKRKSVYHDTRERMVQHFDTCDCETWLKIRYPRVKCPACGIRVIEPPFTKGGSRFTTAFKNHIVKLCKKSSVDKVAKDLGVDWHVVDRIKKSAMENGLKRQRQRPGKTVKRMGIDEKCCSGHDCITVITDSVRGTVLAVLDGRDSGTLINWFATQQVADFSKLKSISMDMAPPYIKAIRAVFPNADDLICFDRFHVAQLFNRAVDTVRRRESAEFRKGENPLSRTRFDWLRNSGNTDNRTSRRRRFLELTKKPLQTAKAWRLKERASNLWNYEREGCAEKAWTHLIGLLSHTRVRELKVLGKTINKHLVGILNSIKLRASNAMAEARNSCIQRIKVMACGYRNKRRLAEEILFQFGGLNMLF